VDHELQRLQRAHEQDPDDAETSRRLKALLLRTGQRDEVRARYELSFICDVRWEDMTRTSYANVRRCETCRRDVQTASTYEQFDALAEQGHCVSVDPRQLPQVVAGLIDAPERGLTRTSTDPCLVPQAPERSFAPFGMTGGKPQLMRELPLARPRPAPTAPIFQTVAPTGAGEHGLVLAHIADPTAKARAAELIAEVKGCGLDEARRLVDRVVIPVLKGVSREVAELHLAKFTRAQLRGRVTTRQQG
jgi:hypothetical protein